MPPYLTIRPPGLMFYCRCLFILPRDLRAPSADRRETVSHDRKLNALYNASRKIRGGGAYQKMGQKCKISVDFIQLQTLIANISVMSQDIQNRKDV